MKRYFEYKRPTRKTWLRCVIWAYKWLVVKYETPYVFEEVQYNFKNRCPLCEMFLKRVCKSCTKCPGKHCMGNAIKVAARDWYYMTISHGNPSTFIAARNARLRYLRRMITKYKKELEEA